MTQSITQAASPLLMGIVNVTPDSFSDGGCYLAAEAAIAHGFKLVEEGAAFLDIGGESTRPGAVPVSPADEIARILPVIEGLKSSGARLSVDTRHAATMKAAIAAGVSMVNDITALTGDLDSLATVASSNVDICLMHMQGTPQTMQIDPRYDDVFQEVFAYLAARRDACLKAGIAQERIILDPGIGFGKTANHNYILLKRLSKFKDLGCRLLLGASRKRFIDPNPALSAANRLAGSLAAALWGAGNGVDILRVHNVFETAQALAVSRNIVDAL